MNREIVRIAIQRGCAQGGREDAIGTQKIPGLVGANCDKHHDEKSRFQQVSQVPTSFRRDLTGSRFRLYLIRGHATDNKIRE